ncbi:hypothetical protein IAU60_002762 [Kwoniella sp. DSM 27419]
MNSPADSTASSSKRPTAPLIIPAGNSPISPDAAPRPAEDELTGDKLSDLKAALKRIRPKEDFENIGQIPCARNSLLYGIAGGSGLGAVRFLGSRKPWSAANWAVGSFIAIAAFQWEVCNRARRKELATMRMLQERYPHRHISKLKKASEDRKVTEAAGSGSGPAS